MEFEFNESPSPDRRNANLKVRDSVALPKMGFSNSHEQEQETLKPPKEDDIDYDELPDELINCIKDNNLPKIMTLVKNFSLQNIACLKCYSED